MDLREIEWSDIGWIYLADDRVQWVAHLHTVVNLRVP
jgi:hypothetical protein